MSTSQADAELILGGSFHEELFLSYKIVEN